MSTSRFFSLSTILMPLVACAAIAIICFSLYQREADQIRKGVLERESRRTEIFARFFGDDIRGVIKDLQQLVDGDGLQSYLLTGTQPDLNRAIHRAWFFSRQNPDYDQIRYIDEQGKEVIRINWDGEVIPPGQLQNKADRPYFQKANALPRGEFYISSLDLNVEHGQVEQPIKPTIRIATPVFDPMGRRRGIYIVNYLVGNSVDRLYKFSPQYSERLRMLNPDGYWIKAADPKQEWGFMLSERKGMTLAQSDPTLWSQVSTKPQGQTPYNGGYFTWATVNPTSIKTNPLDKVTSEDSFWVIGSEISPAVWENYFSGLQQTFSMVAVTLLLLVGASWIFFQSRQQLQQEMDRFFVLTSDMVCIAGFDGYFKRVNPAWEKTLGYTKDELISRPFLDFVHAEDKVRTIAETEKLISGGETVSFENRYRCKDGSYRWLSWSARPLLPAQTIFASARDLTERKVAEEQNLQLTEELRIRAGQLEAANRELEAFSYSVSHDLRSPLRHIHGFVELLQGSAAIQAEESSRRHMKVIVKATKEMGMLIDDLLAFSRTGRVEMHLVKVDMRELLDQAIRELEPEARNRKVTWDIKPLPTVAGDPNLLRLVWVNLVSNALKYTRPREEARIEIGQGRPDTGKAGENTVVFYIKDNGVGFDMAYAEKLFGVFQRLHRAEEFEGTGIGLANVQRIVHRHGGHIWAESTLHVGSTFYFSLPLKPLTETTRL
jgi:PAS domain S-box-containing protein